MADPLVSIGIVTYNSQQYLPACLKSVFEQTYQPIEVFVWDNNSDDQTNKWLEQSSYSVKIIASPENLGFGQAHNQLIKQSSGCYYLALNPDVVLDATFIVNLVNIMENNEVFGWGGGKLFLMTPEGQKTTNIYSVGHALRRSGFAFNLTETESSDIFGVNGAAAMYRRSMLEAIYEASNEYFDETFFLYYEDVDLDWRARLLGWHCIHVSEAIAYHVGDASDGRSDDEIIAQAQANRILSIIKNALLFDLIFYNMPRLIMRYSLGYLLDRGQIQAIINLVINRLNRALRQRNSISKSRRCTYGEMNHWFSQAKRQDQSTSFKRLWKSTRPTKDLNTKR